MVGETILAILIKNGLEVVAAIISVIVASVIIPWIKTDMIPWLKEKRLYKIVSIGVNAAEKLSESMEMSGIDKKEYVINYLKRKGIRITTEIDAFIESACHDLDIVTHTVKDQFEPDSKNNKIEDTAFDSITPVG